MRQLVREAPLGQANVAAHVVFFDSTEFPYICIRTRTASILDLRRGDITHVSTIVADGKVVIGANDGAFNDVVIVQKQNVSLSAACKRAQRGNAKPDCSTCV
jgi:hypothetical protein